MTEQTDIAVIGAGPAGLSAATAAAEAGAKVVLIDAYQQPGGQYFKQVPAPFKSRATARHQHQAEKLFHRLAHPNIRLLADTLVWSIYPDNLLSLHGPEAPGQLKASAIVLATGAYDRPVAFPGWTLPGVMTAGAVQTMLKHQRVVPGRRVLVAGTGPLLLAVAAGLAEAGVEVAAVLEGSPRLGRTVLSQAGAIWGQWARLAEGLSYGWRLWRAGIPYRPGHGLVRVLGSSDGGVEGAVLARLDQHWRPISETEETIACDTVCVGYGFIPATALSRLAGAKHLYKAELGGWVPVRDRLMQTTVPHLYAVGDGAGLGGAPLAMIEGHLAGLAAAAAGQSQGEHPLASDPSERIEREKGALLRERRFQRLYGRLFTPGRGLNQWPDGETLLCRCERVTLAQVEEAVSLGADTASAVKGLTRAGMGECQGRLCGPLVAAQIARLTGRSVATVGTYVARPPIHPLPVEVLAKNRTNGYD